MTYGGTLRRLASSVRQALRRLKSSGSALPGSGSASSGAAPPCGTLPRAAPRRQVELRPHLALGDRATFGCEREHERTGTPALDPLSLDQARVRQHTQQVFHVVERERRELAVGRDSIQTAPQDFLALAADQYLCHPLHAESARESADARERDPDLKQLILVEGTTGATTPAEAHVADATARRGTPTGTAREVVVDEPGATPSGEGVAHHGVEPLAVAPRLQRSRLLIDRRWPLPEAHSRTLGGAPKQTCRRERGHRFGAVAARTGLDVVFGEPLAQLTPHLPKH